MKVKLQFDISAKEVRQVIGLPDVEQLQKEVVDAIREKMVAGVEGFDPLSLMRSFISVAQSFPGVESLQKLLLQAVMSSRGTKE
ncbi:MAG: DUF6489 family protein [Candidatus Binatia bacterium]